MWSKLHEVYELKNEMSILALNEKFLTAKKLADEPMPPYIARVKEMARKLKAMKNPIAQGTSMSNILRGLPKDYRHFTTSWELTHPSERTLSNLRARLSIEESRLNIGPAEHSGMALVAKKDHKKRLDAKCGRWTDYRGV